jgi:uncharacterized RDD family membrane protein YckC
MRELDIITPEHVHIRLEPAGVGSRFLAVILDSFIVMAISAAIGAVLVMTLPGGIAAALAITLNFAITWGWHVLWEVKFHGRTPGKRALRLRVIDARGLPVSLHQSLVRNIVRILDYAPAFYGIGAMAMLTNDSRRRLGDIVADTLVVRDAQPLAYTGQLAAERRHNSLRTPRVLRLIRNRIRLEEREFLLTLCIRAERMTPAARYDLMEEVAQVYRRKLDIEEEQISGENLVRDLTAVLFNPHEDAGRRGGAVR